MFSNILGRSVRSRVVACTPTWYERHQASGPPGGPGGGGPRVGVRLGGIAWVHLPPPGKNTTRHPDRLVVQVGAGPWVGVRLGGIAWVHLPLPGKNATSHPDRLVVQVGEAPGGS